MTKYPEQIARWKCSECGYICFTPLQGRHPFLADDIVVGCPDCFAVQSLDAACYRTDCNELGTIDSLNAHGFRYVVTCHKHRPLKQNDA